MKLKCPCGAILIDSTDELPTKAHFLPDQRWDAFWTSVDEAVESSGPDPKEKEAACVALRTEFRFRHLWQCRECGRLMLNSGDGQIYVFSPESDSVPRDLLTG